MDRSEYEAQRDSYLTALNASNSNLMKKYHTKLLLKLINQRYPDMRPGAAEELLKSYIKNFLARSQNESFVYSTQSLIAMVSSELPLTTRIGQKQKQLQALKEEVRILQQNTSVMERVDREIGDASSPRTSWGFVGWRYLANTPSASALFTYAVGQLSRKVEDKIEVKVQEQQGWFKKKLVQTHFCNLEVYNKSKHVSFLRVSYPAEPGKFVDVLFSNSEGLVGVVTKWSSFPDHTPADGWADRWQQYLKEECGFIEQQGKLFKNPLTEITRRS